MKHCTYLMYSLHLYLYFMPETLLKNAGQVFYRMSLYLGLSKVFSWFNWGYGFFWKNTKGMMCLFQDNLSGGIWAQYTLLLLILTLITWLRWYLPGFSTVKVLFFLLQLINIRGEILWGYAHILLLFTL